MRRSYGGGGSAKVEVEGEGGGESAVLYLIRTSLTPSDLDRAQEFLIYTTKPLHYPWLNC